MNNFNTVSCVLAALAIAAIAAPAAAWTGPSTAPPGGNVAAPVNVSGTAQSKTGFLNINNGYGGASYPLSVGSSGSWAGLFNWPYTNGGYGILVGGAYSQFQNPSGYYAQLAYSSYGLYTNGNVYASDVYSSAAGIWMSTLVANNPRNGGQYWYGAYSYIPNPATGGYSCPSGFSAYGPYTIDMSDGHFSYTYMCR
jgi:hypothetical protein